MSPCLLPGGSAFPLHAASITSDMQMTGLVTGDMQTQLLYRGTNSNNPQSGNVPIKPLQNPLVLLPPKFSLLLVLRTSFSLLISSIWGGGGGFSCHHCPSPSQPEGLLKHIHLPPHQVWKCMASAPLSALCHQMGI